MRRRVRHLRRAKPEERSDLRKSTNSGQQRSGATEWARPRGGTFVHLGLGGCDPGALHGRDAVGKDAGTAFVSHGRAEQNVDRGQVQRLALSSSEATGGDTHLRTMAPRRQHLASKHRYQ